jgi:hypothetical protein
VFIDNLDTGSYAAADGTDFAIGIYNETTLTDIDSKTVGTIHAIAFGDSGAITSSSLPLPMGQFFLNGSAFAGTSTALAEDFIGTGTTALTLSSTPHTGVFLGGNVDIDSDVGSGAGTLTVQYVYAPAGTPPAITSAPPTTPLSSSVTPIVSASPQTLTTPAQVVVFDEQVPDWSGTATFDQFNPALGALVAVNLSSIADISVTRSVENLGTTAVTSTATIYGEVQADYITQSVAGVTFNNALGAYDGTLDFAGTSGITETSSDSGSDGGDVFLASAVGTGTVTLPVDATTIASYDDPGDSVDDTSLLIGGTVELSYSYIPCFAAGTRIATPAGNVAIEALRPGDIVRSVLRGTARVVATMSRRVACCANPPALTPVRVRAGAFAPGAPARDLLLSPDHAVYAEGVLIPARYLLNATSITRADMHFVVYWHIEVDGHDILLAEGLPVESYLEAGGRSAFVGGAVTALAPDFSSRVWEAQGCAPLRVTGPEVDAVRARLAGRRSATSEPNAA